MKLSTALLVKEILILETDYKGFDYNLSLILPGCYLNDTTSFKGKVGINFDSFYLNKDWEIYKFIN